MGTSGSFGGSGGKDAHDLRDSVAEWLDGFDNPAPGDAANDSELNPAEMPTRPGPTPIDIGATLRVLLRPRGGGDGPGGGGGGGRSGGTGGRSSGGASRSVSTISRAAGRAGRLALAYGSADRNALDHAGLNYDELRSLGDPVSIGIRIVEVAFDAQPDSTIEDSEARDIVAAVVEWILDQPTSSPPSPEDVVRKTIESTIAEVTLTEVSAKIHSEGASFESRRAAENMIRDLAEEYAKQTPLSETGATEREMASAIENGIRDLGSILGVKS